VIHELRWASAKKLRPAPGEEPVAREPVDGEGGEEDDRTAIPWRRLRAI
jgi:hypothetical protein